MGPCIYLVTPVRTKVAGNRTEFFLNMCLKNLDIELTGSCNSFVTVGSCWMDLYLKVLDWTLIIFANTRLICALVVRIGDE